MRKPSFLDNGHMIQGVLDVLNLIKDQPSYSSEMAVNSKISNRKTFFKYLSFCEKKGLCDNWRIPRRGTISKFRPITKLRFYRYHSINNRGKAVLELFNEA